MRTLCLNTVFTLSFIFTATLHANMAIAQQPGITYNTVDEVDDEQAKWNSHINNQAYLQELEERRRVQAQRYLYGNTTIIINKSANHDCYNRPCDSWGVQYQSEDSSLSYQEGYQPTKIYPIIIVPNARKRYNPTPYYGPPARSPGYPRD